MMNIYVTGPCSSETDMLSLGFYLVLSFSKGSFLRWRRS